MPVSNLEVTYHGIPIGRSLTPALIIRREVERLRLSIGREGKAEVAVSIGVAMCPLHGETGEALLHRADMALYVAKRRGRSQVVALQENEVSLA